MVGLRLLDCEWLQLETYEQRALMLSRPNFQEKDVPGGGFHVSEGRDFLAKGRNRACGHPTTDKPRLLYTESTSYEHLGMS